VANILRGHEFAQLPAIADLTLHALHVLSRCGGEGVVQDPAQVRVLKADETQRNDELPIRRHSEGDVVAG